MSSWLILAIAAGLLAVLYGAVQTASLMRASPGNAKMQEIAAAIQEGAQAYLKRQYTTIALVGVVVIALLTFFFKSWEQPVGFALGAILSGAAGFAGMLISVRANVRTAQAASESLAKGLSMAFTSGAVTGMLVAGFALIGVAGYFALLTGPGGYAGTDRVVVDSLVSLGFGASADLHLRPSGRRHLHQGRRRGRRSWWARSRPAFRKMTPATPRPSPTMSATTSATAPAWPPTCSRPMR